MFVLLTSMALAAMAETSCPVTRPDDWPLRSHQEMLGSDSDTHAWYGSQKLAAYIPVNGLWYGTGPANGYADKFWWYREGFDAREEWKPDLIIVGTRLDDVAEPIVFDNATSGYGKGWDAMLIGVGFPSAGCWELRGSYQGAEELIVVVAVGQRNDQ